MSQHFKVKSCCLPDRCYALAVRYPLMVVGTADRNLTVFNLLKPQTESMTIKSPLEHQTRCVAAFPDKKGFVIGLIEGKFAIQHFDFLQENFSLECHRDGNEIYSVNSVNFHPAMSRCNQPIPCSAFNKDGSMFAYSVCYDWSRGADNHDPKTAETRIFIHLPEQGDDKGLGKRKGRAREREPGRNRSRRQ
ncbi:hypothetical protein FNV43_RR07033 [Rhamnella rubrinervis]|uniref:Uncharacterized protein n=1 Tax=Rhamnella rubrinervis TaxID=2594499 RepID=A0A8K0HFQ6_9ROSA|nr:hypothetical protein FNV43_RR07033 [Rhamnella rubrinervis]